MVTVSIERLREIGIEFPAKDRWKQTRVKISIDWLMRDAGLSEREKNAVREKIKGDQPDKDSLYRALCKLKGFSEKSAVKSV